MLTWSNSCPPHLTAGLIMDCVFIRQLQIEAVIGVHAWERQIVQKLVIDIDAWHDSRKAASTDALHHALDYSAMVGTVREICLRSQRLLLEALGQDIANALFDQHAVSRIQLVITKPGAVAGTAGVGFRMTRDRPDTPHNGGATCA